MKRRLLSILLVLLMVGSMTMGVYAETVTTTGTVTNEDNSVTTTTTITTTTTDPNTGHTTVVIDQNSTTTSAPENPVQVSGSETYDETKVTDENGNVVEQDWVREGNETKEYGTDVPDGAAPGVSVLLTPPAADAESNTNVTKANDSKTTVTGDQPDSPDDKNYDYKETTVQREVTAETGKVTVETTATGDTELKAVGPDTWETTNGAGETVIKQGYYADGTEKVGIYNTTNYFDKYGIRLEIDPVTGEKVWKKSNGDVTQWKEGFDYQYIGFGDESEDWVVDENGKGHWETYKAKYQYVEYGVDENGNPVEKVGSEMSTSPIQFALQDDEGNIVYGYCVDLDTYTSNGAWYTVDNLERGTYYASEESANHIRAIVKNGYWGTKEGTGSLAQIKDMLKADESFPLSDAEIDALTEGEALAVTQAAIWSFANGSNQEGIDDGKTGNRVTGVKGKDDESTARMEALYSYLIGMSEPAGENGATEIINEDHFVKDLQLTVGQLAADQEANSDGNDSNDVYEVELSFSMEVIPDPLSDDLIVKVVDDSDPDNIKVLSAARIAGENKEGEDEFEILHSSTGKYSLGGMTLSENQAYNVKLVVEGTQKLEQGVYVYTAEGGTKASQTFVGLAEGTKGVNVAMGLQFQFNVEDTAHVVEHRAWYEEDPFVVVPSTPSETPEETPKNEKPEQKQPLEELPEEDVPLTEIMEEDVPLANVPMTGDNSLFFIGMSVLSGSGLAGLALTRKKEDEE